MKEEGQFWAEGTAWAKAGKGEECRDQRYVPSVPNKPCSGLTIHCDYQSHFLLLSKGPDEFLLIW